MKTNHLKCLLATLLAVAGFITAKAEDFEVDGLCYNIISEDEKTVEVTYYYYGYSNGYNSYDSDKLDEERLTGYKGDQTIPQKVIYKGAAYTVVAIGSHAFDCCPYLTSLTLPASVVSIDDYAFKDCLSLASIDMPSVSSIESYAFWGCTSLTSVDMPLVTSIGDDAFLSCISLASVDMPSVTSIGTHAFDGCAMPLVDIPASVASIGKFAFYDCDNLKEINVDISNKNYASVDGVLYNKGVTELISCPAGITSLEVPNTVISIKEFAFYSDVLTSISMPSVKSIERYAFYCCDALTSVYMPSATSIGEYTFYQCTDLVYVYMPSVMFIGEDAFSYCTTLVSIDMPSVTSIGGRVFSGCISLVLVNTLSVTSIENSAFYDCTSLALIDMPLVTSIGSYAFYDCTSLISVNMPLVTSIEAEAFSGCTSLTFVDIPASVTSIGREAFSSCDLTSIFCHWQEPLRLTYSPFTAYSSTLYVPAGTKSAYETVYPWSEFENIVDMYYSSIDETQSSTPTVTVIDGAIVIEGETDMVQPVEVYSTGGQCVHRGTGTRIEGLQHGVYVIKVGESTQKVVL